MYINNLCNTQLPANKKQGGGVTFLINYTLRITTYFVEG